MNARIWTIVGGLLAVGIIAMGWFLGASPLLSNASSSDEQTAAIESDNAAQEVLIAQMKEQYENIDALRAELDALQLSVPGFDDSAAYFAELAQKAQRSRVALQSATISGAQPYGAIATGDIAGQSSQLSAPTLPSESLAQNLYVLEVSLAVDADERQFENFLAELQSEDGRLMTITSATGAFGTSQRAQVSGYIFVVHDPRLGAVGTLPLSEDEAEPTAEPTETATPEPEATTEP